MDVFAPSAHRTKSSQCLVPSSLDSTGIVNVLVLIIYCFEKGMVIRRGRYGVANSKTEMRVIKILRDDIRSSWQLITGLERRCSEVREQKQRLLPFYSLSFP
jgi:hypothetical protein